MSDVIPARVGDSSSFSKTVGESDVYGFAGITGDFGNAHTNEEHMKKTPFGQRIAHGSLLVGFMSTASVQLGNSIDLSALSLQPVSLGYDGIRFVGPVFIGDTVTVNYTVTDIDDVKKRTIASIEVKNQNGDLVAVGKHIMKWLTTEG